MVALNYMFKIKKLKTSFYILLVIMMVGTFPYLFYNESRPLLPLNNKSMLYQDRILGYFNNKPDSYIQYKNIINKLDVTKVSKHDSIALHLGGDSWDYPFLVMLKKKFNSKTPYIFHLEKDEIYKIENKNLFPKYIIFENRFSNNLKGTNGYYQIKEVSKDFSLLKRIN